MRKRTLKSSGFALLVILLGTAWGCTKKQPGADKESKDKGDETARHRKGKGRKRYKVPPCPEEDKNKIVATVNGEKISKCDLYDKIHKLSPYIRRRYTSVKRKKDFLDRIIRFELLAQEAQRRGFEKHPDVQRSKKR